MLPTVEAFCRMVTSKSFVAFFSLSRSASCSFFCATKSSAFSFAYEGLSTVYKIVDRGGTRAFFFCPISFCMPLIFVARIFAS